MGAFSTQGCVRRFHDNLSPAQKLFGRPIQDTLPAHNRAFTPEWQRSAEETEAAAASHLAYSENTYNMHARELPEIRTGSCVVILNPCTKACSVYLRQAIHEST